MLARNLFHAAAVTGAFFAFAAFNASAQQTPAPVEHHDVTILHLVETAQTSADHEVVAKRFDEEAAQFDQQAVHHEGLAKRYRSGGGVGPRANAAALARHCDNLVKNLKASAADAREMANLHRGVAEALAK